MMAEPRPPRLVDRLPRVRGRLTEDAPLAPFTWFRVGGPAEILFRPADPEDLAAHPLRIGLSMRVRVDTHERDGHLLDSDTPLAALATRVHDGIASEAQAAAEKVIRDNRGG